MVEEVALALAAMERELEAMEKEATRLHREAKELNIHGRLKDAQDTYLRMYALEDDSLRVASYLCEARGGNEKDSRRAACGEGYAESFRPPPWPSQDAAGVRGRALGCVLGCVLGDGAAMGVHWVYDLAQLKIFAQTRQTAQVEQAGTQAPPPATGAKEGCDPVGSMLEFYAPPQSPYFSYPSGRPSPYGEQTLCLLHSLLPSGSMSQDAAASGERGRHPPSTEAGAAEASDEALSGTVGEGQGGGFCALRYAGAVARMYGQGWDGYRDASIKGFLRNWYRGLAPPRTGADDCQANCFTRLAPLVALYCGDTPRLLKIVERATRVTQNHDVAVAWAMAGATVLQAVILHHVTPEEALRATIGELGEEGSHLSQSIEDDGLREEVAYYLQMCLDCVPTHDVSAAVAKLGRNCHLPNSMQTPLHAAARFTSLPLAAPQEKCSSESNGPIGASSVGLLVGKATRTEAELSLPPPPFSSMRDASTYLPSPAPLHDCGQRRYMNALRAVIGEGGCCASRAGLTGALLGAYYGVNALPTDWQEQVTDWESISRTADELMRLRDKAGESSLDL